MKGKARRENVSSKEKEKRKRERNYFKSVGTQESNETMVIVKNML